MTEEAAGTVVRVSVTPTMEDLLLLNRRFYAQRWTIRYLRGLSSVMVFAFVVFTIMSLGIHLTFAERLVSFCGTLFMPAIVFIGLPYVITFRVQKMWNGVAEIREPRSYAFSDSCIQITGATFSGNFAWSHIMKAEKIDSLYALMTWQRVVHYIPLQAFETQAHERAFKQLVKAKVADCELRTYRSRKFR